MSLPSTWELVALGEIARVYAGGTPSRSMSAYWGGRIPWVSTAEIDTPIIQATRECITELGLAHSPARLSPAGTLVMAMYGQGKTRGKTSMLGIEASMNQACAAIEPGDRVDAQYLLAYLRHNYDMIRRLSNAGSQENLSGQIVKRIPVVLPPIEEQRRISGVIGDADAYAVNLEHLIAKKYRIRQAIAQLLLTGKSRLPGCSDPWKERRLGELGSWFKGRGITRDDVRPYGVPAIRYGELYTDFVDYTAACRSFVTPEVAATALPIQNGDVLFAASGETRAEIGTCVAYVGSAAAVAGGDTIVLRGRDFNAIFLATLLNSAAIGAQKARLGQGDAVVHISSRALGSLDVRLPDRTEQDAIATVLGDADCEIDALELRLKKARAVKTGMMQELLTGRTRLPLEVAS